MVLSKIMFLCGEIVLLIYFYDENNYYNFKLIKRYVGMCLLVDMLIKCYRNMFCCNLLIE